MCSTPGVRRMLALAWKSMLHNDTLFTTPGSLDVAIDKLSILTHRIADEANFDEIVDALGGSVQDLASTVIQHFDRACCSPRVPGMAQLVRSCIDFLRGSSRPALRLAEALRSAGFIPVLIRTVCVLHDNAVGGVKICLFYLLSTIQHPPGYPHITQGLGSDLLRVIIKVGSTTRVADEKPGDTLRLSTMIIEFLTIILPRASVHYAVVSQLKKMFPEAVVFAVKSAFDMSAFSREWHNFSVLVKARLELLDAFESGKIDAKDNFKCCAACQSINYCSKEYTFYSGKIFLARTARPRLSPADPGEPLVTVFIYGTSHPGPNGVAIDVMPRSTMEKYEWPEAAQLPHVSSHLARSGGRMQVHFAFIYEGSVSRPYFLPLRTSTAKLHDGLLHGVRMVPLGGTVENVSPFIEMVLESVIAEVRKDLIIH
ncbi:hypothetical protein FB451DRAFT_1185520 [Mycena latifolia]|nr:hypothetical protein FB451DRAFT_1185520 [Mycena latifolia]